MRLFNSWIPRMALVPDILPQLGEAVRVLRQSGWRSRCGRGAEPSI